MTHEARARREGGVLAAVALLAVTGCTTPRGVHWRPPLDQQIRTEALELVPAGWEPRVAWMRSHLFAPGERPSSLELAPSPELVRKLQASVREGALLLVDRAVAAGSVNGVSLVRSARAAPASFKPLPVEEPSAGRAAFVLSLDAVRLVGPETPGALLVVGFEFGARELTRAYTPADGEAGVNSARPQAVMGVATTDPVPRPLEAWLADGGRLLRVAHARAAAWAASRLVSELVATTGERAWWTTCGPAPAAPSRGATVKPGARRLEWQPWMPPRSVPGDSRITYDVRVFRLDAGLPEPVLSLDGLADTVATLPEVVTGAVYAWAVRATLELAGGRRFSTAWSRSAVPGTVCQGELEPWLAPRFFVAGELPPPEAGARIPPAPDPHLPLPPLERRAALTGIQVAPLAAPFATVSWEAGPRATGAHARSGALEGALGGVKASAECGILFPVCLVVAPAVGALGGAVLGADKAHRDVPDEEARFRAWRGLQEAVGAPALQKRLEAEVRSALGPAAAAPGQARSATLEVAIVRSSFVGGRTGVPAMGINLELGARLVLPDGTTGYRVVSASYPTSLHLELWLGENAALLQGALGELVSGAAPVLVAAVLDAPDGVPPLPRSAPPVLPPDTEAAQE